MSHTKTLQTTETPPGLLENVDLTTFNTLRLPAWARYYARVTCRSALLQHLHWARDRKLDCLILGGGSNLVFNGDYPGLVLHLALGGRRWRQVTENSAVLELEAGEDWHESVLYAARTGFRGIENLALIPGTVGAAPVQNIGAYGVELSDSLAEVEALDTQTLQWHRLDRDACELAYRESLFKRQPGRYLIARVCLTLSRQRDFCLKYRDLAEAFARSNPQDLTPLQVVEKVMAIRRSRSRRHETGRRLANRPKWLERLPRRERRCSQTPGPGPDQP